MNISLKARLEMFDVELESLSAGVEQSLELQVGALAAAARSEWIRLAQNRLNSTRELYINGLRQAESFVSKPSGKGLVHEITLVGTMPNNVEFGMPAFDMKTVRPGWLGGGKTKTGKDGSKYVVIPFRHSIGANTRFSYTGKAAAVSGPDLKTQLKATARTYGLDRMVRTATGQVVSGAVKRVPNKAPVHPYLKGLTRYQSPSSGVTSKGNGRGSGSLMTFRIMSENSPASAWQHPGLKAVNLLNEVQSWVDSQMDDMALNFLVENE